MTTLLRVMASDVTLVAGIFLIVIGGAVVLATR